MNIKNKFLKNIAGYTLVSIVGFALGIIATPLMTRLYLPDELGTISLFQSSFGLIGVLALAGQDQAFARFFYETDDKKKQLSVNLQIMFFSWGVVTVVVCSLSGIISNVMFGSRNIFATCMCAVCSLPYLIIRMSIQLYQMNNDIKGFTWQSIALNLITKIGVIGVAFINPTANSWIAAYVALYMVLCIIFAYIQIKKNGVEIHFDKSKAKIKEQCKFGLPVMISSFVYMLIAWAAKTILNERNSTYQVGIYASAITIASAINLVESGFNSYFGVYFYENYKIDKGEINIIHHMIAFISFLCMSLMTLLSPVIIHLLGEKYYAAITVYPFLICANILLSLSETTVHGIDISNKTYIHIINSAVSVILGSIVVYFLSPEMGAVGAAIGYFVSMFIFFIMRTLFGQHKVRVVKNLWLTLLCTLSMFMIAASNLLFQQNGIFYTVSIIITIVVMIFYVFYFIIYRKVIKRFLE